MDSEIFDYIITVRSTFLVRLRAQQDQTDMRHSSVIALFANFSFKKLCLHDATEMHIVRKIMRTIVIFGGISVNRHFTFYWSKICQCSARIRTEFCSGSESKDVWDDI